MSYCAEKAIPHSRFLEEWLPEDREKLMAHMIESSDRCTLCGTSGWEWDEDRFAYEAVRTECQGCVIKDAAREDANGPGTSIVLVPPAEAARLREKPRRAPGRRKRE